MEIVIGASVRFQALRFCKPNLMPLRATGKGGNATADHERGDLPGGDGGRIVGFDVRYEIARPNDR